MEMNRESCEQQSGAVEACWAHNPEVGRSKLPSAITFFLPLFCLSPLDPFKIPESSQSVPLAQRIARWTSNPKVLGSIPRWDDTNLFLEYPLFYDASCSSDKYHSATCRGSICVCIPILPTYQPARLYQYSGQFRVSERYWDHTNYLPFP